MLRMQERLSLPFLMLLSLPSTAMGFALAVQISALSWLMSTKYGLKLDEIGIVWAAGPLAVLARRMSHRPLPTPGRISLPMRAMALNCCSKPGGWMRCTPR